jgi:hypothetical protein
MRIEVYEGGNGDVVLCQEWPALGGEQYTRVIISVRDAERVAHEILALVKRLKK